MMTEENDTKEHRRKKKSTDDSEDLLGDKLVWVLFVAAILILFNGFQLISIASTLTGTGGSYLPVSFKGSTAGDVKLNGKETVAPALTALVAMEPAIAGYKTRMVKMETISELPEKTKTGDAVQDAINAIIPTGTPFYGEDAGVSFDDPISSLKVWGNHERKIQLTPELQARWEKIVGSFTCDYCCGSPQNPTIINRCGCAHAASWRGIAKWMLNKYGDKYTDTQIMGEMSRWKALYYPGPTVKRAFEEGAI